MTTILCRIKEYEAGNVIVSVPGAGEKRYFLEPENRESARENFPLGSPAMITLGDKKATKGTAIRIDHLTEDEVAVLKKEEENHCIHEPQESPFTTAAEWETEGADLCTPLEKALKKMDPDYGQFNVTTDDLKKEARKEKVMVPDVNVSVRDALIAQQSCLNRAVEIFGMENPVRAESTLLESDLIDIIFIKDQLFADIWEKSGMTMKEKKV